MKEFIAGLVLTLVIGANNPCYLPQEQCFEIILFK